MRILAFIFCLFCLCGASAQKTFTVLDWKTDVTLNAYLVQEMKEQYEKRKMAFAQALVNKTSLNKYQRNVQQKFTALLGTLPEKRSLNTKVTGRIQQDGYSIEKVIFESFPNHHVTANFYLPEGKGPFPAALLFCGHEDVSKATESYQKTAVLLAKNGFAVLVVDPISQSERHQLIDNKGNPKTRGGTTEHTVLNGGSNLVGTSTPAYELWDNIRSMDYLVSRKEVDSARIGCLGNSGGAMQAIYYSAYDARVKVVVPVSYLATRERTLELTGPADGCAQIPGEGKAGLEISDYLIASAPKPILVIAGRYDFIDYEGTKQAYDELKKVYTVMGCPDHVKFYTFDDGHGISKPKREAAVTWFRKWFYNDSIHVIEYELSVLNDKELFATNTGQVGTEYKNEVSIADRNRELFDSMMPLRKRFLSLSKAQIRDTIHLLISANKKHSTVHEERVGEVLKENLDYQKLILRKQNEVPLPVITLIPEMPKKIIILLHDKGKGKLADSTLLMRHYIQQGYAILLADLRGIGETEDKKELNDPKYYNKEYRNAMLALHVGKPLIGQRVTDIYTILQYLESNSTLSSLPIEIDASGVAAIPALHSAAMFPQINRIYLSNTIRSYKTILEQPEGKDWYSFVVPNVLAYYDLPDLVKMVGVEKVVYK